MDLVQAMLFGRPDPDPKVGESLVPSSGSSLSGNDNVKHGPYLCKLHPVDLTYWVSARCYILHATLATEPISSAAHHDQESPNVSVRQQLKECVYIAALGPDLAAAAAPLCDTTPSKYGAYTSVGVPRVDFQLVQPVIVDSIQDKSLKIDRSYLASCKEVQSHPQIHQQQQGPLLSCMRWFHETMRTAMSSIDELHLEYSPAITGANTCPYINLISKQPCPALLQLCRVCALLSRCSPYAFWPS